MQHQNPPHSPLTDSQYDAFFSTGFVVVPGLFSRDEMTRIQAAFDRLEEMACTLPEPGLIMHEGSQFVIDHVQEPEGSERRVRIRRVTWCGAAEPTLLDFGKDHRLLRLAAALLGSASMQQLINQAHFKLPGDNVRFPWHQDSRHRGYGTDAWRDVNGRGSYVQIAVAVDDVTEDNGPLQFIPGSCQRGHLNLPYDEDEETVADAFDPASAVSMLAKVGDAVLFGPYTIHGSQPNRSASRRRVFINGYAHPGANTRQYPGEGAGRMVQANEP